MPAPTPEFVDSLRRNFATTKAECETWLLEVRAAGRDQLSEIEEHRYRGYRRDLAELSERIRFEEGELQRAHIPDRYARLGGGGPDLSRTPMPRRATLGSAARLAPLGFEPDEVRRLQSAAQRGDPCRIETRAFSTADSLLPAQLWPYPIAAVHEWRILDRLPGIEMDTAQITFIQHTSTTGAAGTVAEGAAKPELVFNTAALTETARKVSAHSGLSYEIINDFEAFHAYAVAEIYKDIIDAESNQLLLGDGTAPNMTGFFNTSGILTHDASTDTGTNVTVWDSLEIAINTLRVGPALAEPDLMIFNPTDWSAIRRTKDTVGRYLILSADNDTSNDQVNEAWGVPVLVTTACPAGKGLLLDSQKFGYVAVREPLSMRIGYSGTDLTQNILRFVGEERLVLCVTRPAAVLAITSLP